MQKFYSCRFCKEPGSKKCRSCNGYGGRRKKAPSRQRNGKVIYLPPPMPRRQRNGKVIYLPSRCQITDHPS